MLLETMQLLATALRHHNVSEEYLPHTIDGKPYRSTHANHPCSLWAKASRGNMLWLVEHAEALAVEYMIAYNKEPALYSQIKRVLSGILTLPDAPMTPFVNCSLYKDLDVFEAYRLTMRHKWENDKREATWKGLRSKPIT